MKLFLGGWRDPTKGENAVRASRSCIEKLLQQIKPAHLLHIPSARTGIRNKIRNTDNPIVFGPFIERMGISYFNGEIEEDIRSFNGDVVFINGGNDNEHLLETCMHPLLYTTLQQSRVIIRESAGAIIRWQLVSTKTSWRLLQGFNRIKDTIIMPHFTEKAREEKLIELMQAYQIPYGMGIDENTFILYEDGNWWDTLWYGKCTFLNP